MSLSAACCCCYPIFSWPIPVDNNNTTVTGIKSCPGGNWTLDEKKSSGFVELLLTFDGAQCWNSHWSLWARVLVAIVLLEFKAIPKTLQFYKILRSKINVHVYLELLFTFLESHYELTTESQQHQGESVIWISVCLSSGLMSHCV